jgi:hypothetical protein
MQLEISHVLRHPESPYPVFHVTPSTEYVWLVLCEGPPGSFPQSQPAHYKSPPDADAWLLIRFESMRSPVSQ